MNADQQFAFIQQLVFMLIDDFYSKMQFFQLLFSLLTLSNVAFALCDLLCADVLLNSPDHITGFDIKALQNNISQSEGGLV